MSLYTKVAWGNIFRNKRRSLLTALSMLGGFILTAVAIGITDGTFNGIVNAFTRSRLGHIQIHARGYVSRPSLNKAIRDYREIGQIISQTGGAEAWAPRVYSGGLASVGERSAAARIMGIDPALETKATHFDKKITRGRDFSAAASKEIILGKGLAQNLKASLGDNVVLVSQGADGSLANDKYRLIGLTESGDVASDLTTLFLHIDDARELLVLDDKVHELIVISDSLKKVTGLNALLRQKLAAYAVDVQPWQEFAQPFYMAMQAKKKGQQVILLVLFIIVAIGVLNTALMTVLERRREYGVLKAIGTRPRQIFSLIVLEIQLLALGSIVLGFGISLPINSYLSRHGIPITGLFSKPVTFGGMQYKALTSEINLRSFLIPAITVLISAFLVSIFPALKAARTEPAKSIRIF
jgi:ABC-type lipoprotein release transport system permease subunit